MIATIFMPNSCNIKRYWQMHISNKIKITQNGKKRLQPTVLCHVDEHIDIVLISSHVSLFDQPLDLLLNHLLGWKKHVL